MRKISVFIFAVLIISSISAVEFNVNEEYPQGGAIITKISGSFQEALEDENILFYRGNVRVPMDFELNKIADEYYLYVSLADKDPNNYSVVLEEIEYLEGAKVIEEDLQRNFTITQEIVDFSINKGFIMTEDDFKITVQNLRETRINLTYEFTEKEKVELFSGEIIELDFDVSTANRLEIIDVKLSSEGTSYDIPVYVLGEPDEKEPVMFEFDSADLNVTMDIINQTNRTIHLRNTGTETIFQVKVSLSDELERYTKLSKEELFDVRPGFLYPIVLTFISGELPSTTKGQVIAISSGREETVNVTLKFFPDYIESEKEKESSIRACSELGGFLCDGGCDGELALAEDGNCCLGICEDKSGSSSLGKAFGWLLLIIVIAAGAWFYLKKYRGAEAPARGIFKLLKR